MTPIFSEWQYGVLAAFVGSFSGSLGFQLRMRSLAHTVRVATALQAVGWMIWLFGQGLGQVAILLAPATLAACVTFSSSLLSNALLAPLVLRERLTRTHGLGICLLSLGGVAVTVASRHKNQEYSWAQLCGFARRPATLAAAGCLALAVLAVTADAAHQKSLTLSSFAFLFALCGSVDLVITKFTLQLLRTCAVSPHADVPSHVVVTAFTALMVTMHLAVFRFQVASIYYGDALKNMPIFFGSGVMLQVLVCGVFFDEFGEYTLANAVTFVAGMVSMLAGMLVTCWAAQHGAAPVAAAEEVREAAPEPRGAPGPSATIDLPAGDVDNTASVVNTPASVATSATVISMASDVCFIGELQRTTMCFGRCMSLDQAPVYFPRSESCPPKVPKGNSCPQLLEPFLRVSDEVHVGRGWANTL